MFIDVGRWWYKEHEVDVVGLINSGPMVVGECEFTTSPLDYSALASLEEHADEIRWSSSGETVTREYALFSRNGFTRSVREAAADRDDLQSFSLDQIVSGA